MSWNDALAQKMDHIEASGIRKMFHMASKMDEPTNLSIGQPDFDVPDPVKHVASKAIREGRNKYTQTRGLEELRKRIKNTLLDNYDAEAEEYMVTSGVSGGLFLAFHVLLDPGEEILVPDPYFVMYKHLANAIHAEPRFIDTYPDFKIDPETLNENISDQTKMLVFNNPVNPTGMAYREDEVEEIAEVCRDRDVLIVADEIYADFSYDFPHTSMLEKAPNRTILTGGFSKTYGMPGWRVGYAAGPSEIIDAMATLQQFSYVCAHTPSQHACVKALEVDMSPAIQNYREKRDFVYEGLDDVYEPEKPQGAFYIFPRIPGGDEEKFVDTAIDEELMIVPGSAMSRRSSHFRISFAVGDHTLERGVELLNKIADRLK